MTDNTKNYILAKAFQRALGRSRQLTTRPYWPQTNGKAERFNRALADERAYDRPFNSNAETLVALETFLINYYYERTHSSIGNRPPASRRP